MEDTPVNVTRLQVSVPVMITILVFMLGGVVSMTLVWAKTSDPQRHIEPNLVTAGGGVAYKHDVRDASDSFQKIIAEQQHLTRKLLLGMKLTCKKIDSSMECKVSYLPEPD